MDRWIDRERGHVIEVDRWMERGEREGKGKGDGERWRERERKAKAKGDGERGRKGACERGE